MYVRYIVNIERRLYSIPEAACYYGMYEEKLYSLVKSGAIRSKQMGRRLMIYGRDIEKYLIEENKRLSGES